MPTILEPATTVDLCKRIMQEYRGLPALCLTMPQAARLFQVEVARCVEALQELESAGFLHRIGQRYFCAVERADEGERRAIDEPEECRGRRSFAIAAFIHAALLLS